MTEERITLADIIEAREMIEKRREESDNKSYDYGLDFVITKKENGNEVELPRISLLISSLSKLEYVFKEIMNVANKQSKESLKDQKRSIIHRIEWLQEVIEEAYSLPSKIDLLENLNECIEYIDEARKDAEYYKKRYHLYAKKYKEEKMKDPNFDEDDYYDGLLGHDGEDDDDDDD